jgi:hypothetical protein
MARTLYTANGSRITRSMQIATFQVATGQAVTFGESTLCAAASAGLLTVVDGGYHPTIEGYRVSNEYAIERIKIHATSRRTPYGHE